MKKITTSKAPAAIGPYSQGLEVMHSDPTKPATICGGLVFVSGQLPLDPQTGGFPGGGIQEQTRQCLLNVEAVLKAAGLSMHHVVKTTVYLDDIADFAAMNEVYGTFFSVPYPARSAFAVRALPKGALVEIEAVAARY